VNVPLSSHEVMTDERDKEPRARRTPPQADAAEAVERIVPRRHLIIENGDVLIVRTSGGFRPNAPRSVYQFHVHGDGLMPDRFAAFEHVAVAGEQLAETRRVRLFFQETNGEPPFLLRDCRPCR
jgi:hypothetical protein